MRALRQSYSAAEFDALAGKYAALNWRIVSKPGGATVKPDEFYILYGRVSTPQQPLPFHTRFSWCWAMTSDYGIFHVGTRAALLTQPR